MEKRRANGTFLPGSTPWNKGVKGAQVAWNKGKRGYMGKNCTSFSAENLKRSDYKPRIVKDHSRTTMQITLRDTFVPYKNPYNGETYMCHKRIPYAR